MSQRYMEEEDSGDWDSYGNGELPLQNTYKLARKLGLAHPLIAEELDFVLRKVVARIDVHIGRFNGGIDEAVIKLAALSRSMILLSLQDVEQDMAMGKEWCDDWEVGKLTKSLWMGFREILAAVRFEGWPMCQSDASEGISYLRHRALSGSLTCLGEGDSCFQEWWTEYLQDFWVELIDIGEGEGGIGKKWGENLALGSTIYVSNLPLHDDMES